MLAVLSNVLHTNSTSLAGMSLRTDEVNLTVAGVLTCIAFFLVLLAENSRIPVDNPDTHLELTMIHECMTLEYSGRLLALIHWAAGILSAFRYAVSAAGFAGSAEGAYRCGSCRRG